MSTLSKKPRKGNAETPSAPAKIPALPIVPPAGQGGENFTPAIRCAAIEAGRALGN